MTNATFKNLHFVNGVAALTTDNGNWLVVDEIGKPGLFDVRYKCDGVYKHIPAADEGEINELMRILG